VSDSNTAALARLTTSLDAPARSAQEASAFDEGALSALDSGGRQAALALVVARLSAGDLNPRLVEVLATLGTPEALEALRAVAFVPAAEASQASVTAAWRLRLLASDGDALRTLAEVVAADVAPTLRLAAMAALDGAPDALVLPSVKRALHADDRAVRSAAWERISQRLGLTAHDRAGGALFHLSFGLMSRFPSVRTEAQGALDAALARLDAGATPESLGWAAGAPKLSEQLVRFRSTLGIFAPAPLDGSTFALELLDALVGPERDYAADLLIGRLDAGYLAAADGLARLGTPRARAALSDAASTLPDGPLRDAAVVALGRLTAA
jgi:hypothetical protein